MKFQPVQEQVKEQEIPEVQVTERIKEQIVPERTEEQIGDIPVHPIVQDVQTSITIRESLVPNIESSFLVFTDVEVASNNPKCSRVAWPMRSDQA